MRLFERFFLTLHIQIFTLKTKTIMKYKTKVLSLLALLLMAVTQGAWADDTKTVLEDGVFTGFTATAGTDSNNANEG